MELIEKIADYKKRALNKSLPASAVAVLEKKIKEMEAELEKEETPVKPTMPPLTQKKVNKAIKQADKEVKKHSVKPEYDCNELIAKERTRKASSKKSAHKSPAAKSTSTITKVADSIEKKYKEGELTKAQILTMIQKLRKEIKQLETLLKSAK